MDKKQKNACSQDANTRATSYIIEAQKRRDHYMTMYASAHHAMIALGSLVKDDPNGPFPPLTLEDTYMKSRQRKRGLGDSRRVDSNLWHRHGRTVGMSEPPANNVDSEWESEEEAPACKRDHHCYLSMLLFINDLVLVHGTQMLRRKKGNNYLLHDVLVLIFFKKKKLQLECQNLVIKRRTIILVIICLLLVMINN